MDFYDPFEMTFYDVVSVSSWQVRWNSIIDIPMLLGVALAPIASGDLMEHGRARGDLMDPSHDARNPRRPNASHPTTVRFQSQHAWPSLALGPI